MGRWGGSLYGQVLDNCSTFTLGSKQPWGFIYLKETVMNLQIDEYLATKYDWAPSSRKSARKHLGYWATWLDDRDIEDVTISDFEAWIEEMGWSNSMRFNSLWAVTGYLKWAGIDHPLLAHKVRRQLPPPGDYLTQEDVSKLLGQCNMFKPIGAGYFVGLSAQGARDFAVVAFL